MEALPIPTAKEQARRDQVMRLILQFIAESRVIKLPAFDRHASRPSDSFALVNIGLEPNDFSGQFGPYRYQFEGEEDLLHLIVTRNGEALTAEQGQAVASFVLRGMPPALIWLKPGEFSQHFYFGHDELIGTLQI